MANQRKKGKKKIGFWATEAEKRALQRAAKSAGFSNIADWLRSLINTGSKLGVVAVLGLVSMHFRNAKLLSALALMEPKAALAKFTALKTSGPR